jgi:hypothetical protein
MILRRQVIEESLDYLGSVIARLETLRAVAREKFFDSGDRQWRRSAACSSARSLFLTSARTSWPAISALVPLTTRT